MRNPHELDLAPSRYEDEHGLGCECDRCTEAYDHEDEIPTPSEAEVNRRYEYFMRKGA